MVNDFVEKGADRMRKYWKQKKELLKQLSKNNQGFTMVELLVSVMVFAIVSAAVMQMMHSGALIHANVTGTIRMEAEAQSALSLMEELTVEAGDMVYFHETSTTSTYYILNTKDFATGDDLSESVVHMFQYKPEDETIYYYQSKAFGDTSQGSLTDASGATIFDDDGNPIPVRHKTVRTGYEPTKEFVVDDVSKFHVDVVADHDRLKHVDITFEMETNDDSYATKSVVVLRNRLDIGTVW